MVELVEELLHGNRRAAAKLITLLENGSPEAAPAMAMLYPHTGKAHVVGITGPPGSGKSTLVAQLVKELSERGQMVGVLAVDPTSPFTGGAVLGDRVRMQELSTNPRVFIRSMASRGSMGGLARGTAGAARVLDAMGCDTVIVETVGAGQNEVDIARNSHTTLVVEVPGMGDGIQVIKAGILEIADILLVNKADKEGASRVVAELQAMLAMAPNSNQWTPPVLKTTATTGEGIKELADSVESHRKFLARTGELRKRTLDNSRRELLTILGEELVAELSRLIGEEQIGESVDSIARHEMDPASAARQLVQRFSEAAREER